MTDQPKWMPSDEEIRKARDSGKFHSDSPDSVSPLRALISTAVERALAEQEAHIAQLGVCVEDLRRQLAEQEARHKREVIEAKIATLKMVSDRCSLSVPSSVLLGGHLSKLRAELAALEAK